MDPKPQTVFRCRSEKFWGGLLPLSLGFLVIQARWSQWAFTVFSPQADTYLRTLIGYGALLLGLMMLGLSLRIYFVYASRTFEIQAKGLLVRTVTGSRLFPWEEVRVLRGENQAIFYGKKERVRVHRFFLPEWQKLCDLVDLAHNEKKFNVKLNV